MLEFAFHHVLVSQSKPSSRFLLAVHRPRLLERRVWGCL